MQQALDAERARQTHDRTMREQMAELAQQVPYREIIRDPQPYPTFEEGGGPDPEMTPMQTREVPAPPPPEQGVDWSSVFTPNQTQPPHHADMGEEPCDPEPRDEMGDEPIDPDDPDTPTAEELERDTI